MIKRAITIIGCAIVVVSLLSCRAESDAPEKRPDTSVHRLSINVVGAGMVKGPGITCKGTCDVELARGAKITLNAAPANEWTFVGWGGACSGKDTCSLTMESDLSVKAIFTYP